MALIICPECGKQVSDTAEMCPKCGFPLEEFVREQRSINVIDVEMIDVSLLNNGDREILLKAFDSIGAVIGTVDDIHTAIEKNNSRIIEEEAQALAIENKKPLWEYLICFAVGITVGIMTREFGGFSWALAAVSVVVFFYAIIKPIDESFVIKKREAVAEAYREEKIWPIMDEIEKNRSDIEKIYSTEAGKWAMDVIGEEHLNSVDFKLLKAIVETHRADTLKECLNRFDEVHHSIVVEELLADIMNSSKISAFEARKQTRLEEDNNRRLKSISTTSKLNLFANAKSAKYEKKIYKKM